MHDGTGGLTGHHRARCATDRELRATLKDFTTWYASPDRRPDRALESWSPGACAATSATARSSNSAYAD
ncbi:hypothetical protein ACFY3M_21010 [Streptomyces mirabilis]|uniref:hypothetical protein n=1 Tax=Streptomyces mirabilis TaxID=68239 RepID=UPI003696A61A